MASGRLQSNSALLLTPSSTTAQPPSRVTGQVIDGVTEAPLGDASVEGATDAVITESDGRFSIGVGADETTLRVQATGHLDTVSPELPQVLRRRLKDSRAYRHSGCAHASEERSSEVDRIVGPYGG